MDARLVETLATKYGDRGQAVGGWLATLDEHTNEQLSYQAIELLLGAIDEHPKVDLNDPLERELWAVGAETCGIPHPSRLITWLWYATGHTPD